jgi:anti-sigma factor RsiW
MNSSKHVDRDSLERYSLGSLTEDTAAPVEEHLLICAECRGRLESMDAYHKAVSGALKQAGVKLSATATQ